MKKIKFLQREPLTHCGVAFLLACGLMLPMLMAMGLGAHAVGAVALCALLMAALTALSVTRKSRMILWGLLGVFSLVQLLLPHGGVFGSLIEGFKAIALYFSGDAVVLPLYGSQAVGLFVVFITAISFLVSKRGVGFLPMALMTVLVLFGLWSLGKGNYLWYVAPALVAMLLQMSTEAHERINLLHVLPMALAVVLISLVLLPAGKVTVGFMEEAASTLKQRISDYLFFTEARNVFTIGNYGYYPMGSGQLGGAVEPSEYPVMMVKTDRKTLLRAIVKDEYTGRSFHDTSSAKRYLYINPRWQTQRLKAFLEEHPSEDVRKMSALLDEKAITIQMQNNAVSTIFTPVFLRNVNMSGDMVPYFNDASELFITRDLQLGDRYTVFAPLFEGGDTGLGKAVNSAAGLDDKYYDDFYALYTQLPDHLEKKLFDDVFNIIQNAETPYDKALTLMRYLQKYYRYSLTPVTPPDNLDFVTYFLYVKPEGYCTYFASAMTVMCRIAGLPTRYVEGFLAQPSSDGFAYVTGYDAHAWTEVYFKGFGWVPFDPTPNQYSENNESPNQGNNEPEPTPTPTPSPNPNQQNDEPTPTPNPDEQQDNQNTPQPSDSPDNQPDPDNQKDNPPLWWLLLVLAAIAGAGARAKLCGPDRIASKRRTDRDKIFVYGAATAKLLALANYRPKAGETPLAFARRVDAVHFYHKQITPLWRILSLSNYSRLMPGPDQTRKAKETYHAVFKETKPLRKLRFLMALMFTPRLYQSLDTRMQPENPASVYAPMLDFSKRKQAGNKKKPGATNAPRKSKAAAPKIKPRGRKNK